MLCRNPFIKAGAAFPCGRCEPCSFNRKRLWKHRIMLEAACHSVNSFVTLTYRDEELPRDEGIPVLRKEHLQAWLKRLRSSVDFKFRFYGVGEYGDKSDRPHYHVILFGFPTCIRGRTLRRALSTEPVAAECCDICRIVSSTWNMGNVDLGTVTSDSAAYVADYTIKRMTRYDDIRLNGRTPEFCRMSLRPGIGANAVFDVASDLMKYGLDEDDDVPTGLMHGKSTLPLGRYLRKKLRLAVGKDGGVPVEVMEKMAEEMRPLREAAFNSSSSFAAEIVKAGNGRFAQINARNAIYKKGKVL